MRVQRADSRSAGLAKALGAPTAFATLAALVVFAIHGLTSGPFAAGQSEQSQTGIPQVPQIGIPRRPVTDAPAGPRRLQTAVRLVKLDSCDPAILAKPPRKPVDMGEAAEQGRARVEMEHYHAMLTAYAEGDAASSIEAALALSRKRLARDWTGLTHTLLSINKRDIDPYAPWDARRYALAVMLHTDAALRAAGDTYSDDMYDQLQVAADLLQLGVTCAPDRFQSLAPRWYVGLSRYLRDRTVLQAAETLLEVGRTRLDGAAAVLAESGLLAESVATIYALSQPIRGHSWVLGDSQLLRQILERRQGWLSDASSWLSRAVALEPGNDEVSLHLGRVRALWFADDEALGILGGVLERTQSNDRAYLAALFIAAVLDRQNRLEDAAASYRVAIERVPGGHAARVGLADVLRRSGKLDDASGLLRALVTERPEGKQDPLWWYILEPPGKADARLAGLRAEVRR